MILRLFRLVMQSAAIAALATPVYLNFYNVPSGHHGLLKESTLGWQFPPLGPGRHWLWTGFVPDKWQLITVPIHPPPLEIAFQQGLRFTDVLDLDDQFRIRVNMRVFVRIEADSLPVWLRLTGENPAKITTILEERLKAILQNRILELYRSDSDIPRLAAALQNYLLKSAEAPFAADWQRILTEQDVLLAHLESWEVQQIYVPDAAAYAMQTRNMAEVFAARRKALTENIFARARVYEKQLSYRAEREHLEDLRELLQANPSLRDYLKYDRLSKGSAPVTIIEGGMSAAQPSMPPREGQVAPLAR